MKIVCTRYLTRYDGDDDENGDDEAEVAEVMVNNQLECNSGKFIKSNCA